LSFKRAKNEKLLKADEGKKEKKLRRMVDCFFCVKWQNSLLDLERKDFFKKYLKI
jgi:hypothetical protein